MVSVLTIQLVSLGLAGLAPVVEYALRWFALQIVKPDTQPDKFDYEFAFEVAVSGIGLACAGLIFAAIVFLTVDQLSNDIAGTAIAGEVSTQAPGSLAQLIEENSLLRWSAGSIGLCGAFTFGSFLMTALATRAEKKKRKETLLERLHRRANDPMGPLEESLRESKHFIFRSAAVSFGLASLVSPLVVLMQLT